MSDFHSKALKNLRFFKVNTNFVARISTTSSQFKEDLKIVILPQKT